MQVELITHTYLSQVQIMLVIHVLLCRIYIHSSACTSSLFTLTVMRCILMVCTVILAVFSMPVHTYIYVTRPAKTGHVGTNYTLSHYRSYLSIETKIFAFCSLHHKSN